MEELIRDKIHDALDVEQPDGGLRSRILASLPVEQRLMHRTRAGSFQLAGGAVAVVLAVTLVVVILYSGGPFNKQPAHVGQCQYLYSPSGAFRPSTRQEYIFFINESASTCMIRAPQIAFIDNSGNKLNVPQDWAPGATEGFVILESMAAASVQFSIAPDLCSTQSMQFVSTRASFGSDADVNVPVAGGLCKGDRILVWAPTPAVACADGSYVDVSPNSPKPTC
jgi:hypothetical protein